MQQKTKTSRAQGIDGLRGLSILAILVYHLNLPWLPSGHMGVVIFLVLSGYFATTTMSRALYKSDRNVLVELLRAWAKRIMRIVPSVVALIAVVGVLCASLNHVLLTKMRPDVVPSLGFYLNWSYILRDVSYFDKIGGTSPVLHLWYLGVDLQFFLAWSVLLCIFHKLGKPVVRRCALVLAVASAVWMGWRYMPGGDPSRVYYGTDTRAFSLLIGSWLAFAFPLGKKPMVARGVFIKSITKEGQHAVKFSRSTFAAHLLGLVCLAAIAASMVIVPADSILWYRGGMFAFSLLTALLVATMLSPKNFLGTVLGLAPFRTLGKLSFSLYLWHYPVFQLMAANKTTTAWWMRLAAVGVAFVAAGLSYLLVEKPFDFFHTKAPAKEAKSGEREKTDGKEARAKGTGFQAVLVSLTSLAIVIAGTHTYQALKTIPDASILPEEALVSTGAGANQAIDLSQQRAEVAKTSGDEDGEEEDSSGTSGKKADKAEDTSAVGDAKTEKAEDTSADGDAKTEKTKDSNAEKDSKGTGDSKKSEKTARVKVTQDTVLHAPEDETSSGQFDPILIGDSVPGDAGDDLTEGGAGWDTRLPDALIDTYIGRMPHQALEVLKGYLDQGGVGKVVVMACFSNIAPYPETLDAMAEAVGPERELYLVGTVNPDGFQDEANAKLQEAAGRHDNVHYVDWPSVLEGHLHEYLWADDTHLRPEGAKVYVDMVVRAIAQDMVDAGGTATD